MHGRELVLSPIDIHTGEYHPRVTNGLYFARRNNLCGHIIAKDC